MRVYFQSIIFSEELWFLKMVCRNDEFEKDIWNGSNKCQNNDPS